MFWDASSVRACVSRCRLICFLSDPLISEADCRPLNSFSGRRYIKQMNIERLRAFIKISECGSVSRVAEQMGISQPSLTRQLKILEKEIGRRLLVRQSRGMGLTRAGEAFRFRIIKVIRQFDQAVEDVRGFLT